MEKKSILKNDNNIYVFKDQDGYFLAKKGTCIVKRISRQEFENYRRFLPEYGVRRRAK